MTHSNPPSSRWTAGALVLAGLVAGVFLATGLEWTQGSRAERGPTSVAALASTGGVSVPVTRGGVPSFADLAEAVAPAVVTIRTVTFATGPDRRGAPFLDLFRRPDPDEDSGLERREEAGGSGFLVDPRGLVVTNYHVIERASEVRVTLDEGRELPATVRGVDPDTDLALLQIQLESDADLPFLHLGAMEDLRVGDWVMVVGNPLRLGRTVTVGVVSATGRTLNIMEPSFENFIQTDAAINFGNSGGPMVDLRGRVVGVATAIDWGAENIGFAVPVSTLQHVVPQLASDGRVRRGYLGVEIEDVDFQTQKAFGLESSRGVLVLNVVPDTPAAKSGLRHGDVVLRVDDERVDGTRSLIDYVARQEPGSALTLDLVRDGRSLAVEVLLEERPHTETAVAEPPPTRHPGIEWLGVEYQDLTPGLKEAHGIPGDVEGVWIQEVAPRSPLSDERVRPGDLIVEVDGEPVGGVGDFERVLEAAESEAYVRFYVRRFDPRNGRSSGFFAFVRKP